MPMTEWENGITHTEDGHDMLLPVDDYVGQFQARHYFFVRVPILDTGIGRRTVTRGFKYQFYEGAALVFETEVEIVLEVIYMAAGGFGTPALSFASYNVIKERIRTTMINGVPTDPVEVINSATTSGKIQDFNGRVLDDAEVDALENPAFKHTLGGYRTSEFGNAILDTDRGVGTDEAIVDGRYELPIYKQDAGPETQVDIVFDSLQAAGRADLYQFRFGGTQVVEAISSTMDIHGGMSIAVVDKLPQTVVVRKGGEPFIYLEDRDILPGLSQPSIMVDKYHRFFLGSIDRENGVCEERLSTNGGRTFKRLKHGVIYKGLVSMLDEVVINESTGERGALSLEGNTYHFKRSGDNWAASVPIVTFTKPEPMALTATKSGVLYASNGKGVTFESRNKGGTWRDRSVAIIP